MRDGRILDLHLSDPHYRQKFKAVTRSSTSVHSSQDHQSMQRRHALGPALNALLQARPKREGMLPGQRTKKGQRWPARRQSSTFRKVTEMIECTIALISS
jgi:hypothetical protein